MHQPISIFNSQFSTRPPSAHISSLATPPAYSPTPAPFSPSIGESKGTNKRVKKQIYLNKVSYNEFGGKAE